METIPSWFVILMGMGTVFIGLICIILLSKILGVLCSHFQKDESTTQTTPQTVSLQPAISENGKRREMIAAIGVAIAEEIGVDASAIRIVSIQKK